MVAVTLEIEPEMCGPISVGTVAIVTLLRDHLALSLGESLSYVDRCVFDRASVEVPAPSQAAADALLVAISKLPPVPRVSATIRV